jgi:hypothetical protein
VHCLLGSRASLLRQELIGRNQSYATLNALPHVMSYGALPVVVYQRSESGQYHGNFIPASYRAILGKPPWRKRLEKVHAQGRRCLPAGDGPWRELDSSVSSDALLMNVFCYPRITSRADFCNILGIESGSRPEFGFKPRVPLLSGAIERTEIDMKVGNVLFEAKLTEADFQLQRAELVEGYRDFREVFACRQLPRIGKKYVSYQLIRNILAAYALDLDFCTLIDGRRPELIEEWYALVCCVRSAELRVRCKVLTWQELAGGLPSALQSFLNVKYGITPAGQREQLRPVRP